jgi:preprotein translocase subunit SecE
MKTTSGTSETTNPAPPKKRVGPFTFFGQVRSEARKVTWTTRKETIWATTMVIIMVIVASLFFYLTDVIVSFLVKFVTGTGDLNG